MLALYVLIVGGEVLFASDPIGQLGAHPHPYWLVILSMAAAHGTVAGLVSAAVGVLLQILGLTIDEGFSDALSRVWSQGHNVLLFFGGAYLVGEIHDSHARRHFRLREDLHHHTQDALRLAYERDALLTANQRLRQRIEEQPAHMADLLRSSARMNTPHLEALLPAVLELVTRNCGTSRASVWSVGSGGLLGLIEERGWHPSERDARELALQQSEFLRYVLHSGQAAQAFEFRGRLRPEDPIFAAPLLDGDGNICALVLAEEIPANLLSPTAASVFFGIVEWAAHALTQGVVEQLPEIEEEAVPEPPAPTPAPAPMPRRVRPLGDLEARLRMEFSRAGRYGSTLSVVMMRVRGWCTTAESALQELDRVVARSLGRELADEELYRTARPGVYCTVLTGELANEIVSGALVQAATQIEGLPIDGRAFGVDPSMPDVNSLQARVLSWLDGNTASGIAPFSPVDVDSVGHVEDLLVRLRLERRVAREQGHPLHLVLFRANPNTDEADLVRGATEARRVLRPTDGVYVFEPSTIALLLPQTDAQDAQHVVDRFLAGWLASGEALTLSSPEPQILACHTERLAPLGVLSLLGGRA